MATSRALLQGPIAAQLLRLAWPVLAVLALQTSVAVAETYFVSFLGTDALAGVALVFPVFMLMTMMSNGGIGGGGSSGGGRAPGAGDKGDAPPPRAPPGGVGAAVGAGFRIPAWARGGGALRVGGGRGGAPGRGPRLAL